MCRGRLFESARLQLGPPITTRSVRTLGIIGGTGPESTVEYYRRLIAAHRARDAEHRPPSLIINSVDNTKLIELFTANELGDAADYLAVEIERLARAGADFALIAALDSHSRRNAEGLQGS